MENIQSKICFYTKKWKKKKTLLKMIIHSKDSPQELNFSSPIYRQIHASQKPPFHKQNLPKSPQE